jgi:hypothetical protein
MIRFRKRSKFTNNKMAKQVQCRFYFIFLKGVLNDTNSDKSTTSCFILILFSCIPAGPAKAASAGLAFFVVNKDLFGGASHKINVFLWSH